MENRYHIILTGKNLYKEAELTPDMKSVRLGTATECEIRLRKEQFFGQVELTFVQNEGTWTVLCSDNLYLNVGDARKLFTLRLTHGNVFHVHYQESNNELFSVEFLIDFENERKKFTRRIDIRGLSSFGIGAGAENQIILGSRFVKNDSLLLSQANNSLTLNIRNTTYGVYINGRRAKNGERIQNSDFFSISDAIFYYKDGFLWTEDSESIKINRLSYTDESAGREYPRFKRNSRVKVVPSDEKIEILDPPAKPEKPKTNLIQRLLPSMGMLIASGVMAFIGSPSMLIFSGISGAMAIVTAVYGIKEGKKDYEEKTKDRLDKYNAYIANKRTEIEQARQAERTVLEEIYASTDVERQNLTNFSYNLFDRSRDDEDFLCVRLGTGDVEAKREINYKKQERLEIEDDLQLMPAQLSETYHNVQGAPVVCDLKAVNAVGVTGAIGCRLAILKAMVLDIVARQFHSDVQLMFVSDEANQAQVWRYRMLPHVYNETLHTRNIVCNAESKNLIFEYLYKELSAREQNKAHDQHIVVFFLNEFGFN
ncbi:MAG: type VII secretion protein EssC, partial [Lachnospiraceae bacterium]